MSRRDRDARRTDRARPCLDILERRELLTTFTVTSDADSGTGSLRAAIVLPDTDPTTGVDTIDFAIGPGGFQTITPLTTLPTITHPVDIDGTSQSPASATPPIEISGFRPLPARTV